MTLFLYALGGGLGGIEYSGVSDEGSPKFDTFLDAVVDRLPDVAKHPDSALAAVLAEQHDEWVEGRRYLGLELSPRPASAWCPASRNDPPLALTA